MTISTVEPSIIEPTIVGPGEGEAYWVLGGKYTFKLRGKDTGGALMLLEAEIPPGPGPPPHIHRLEDETFSVLDGELTVMIDGKIQVVGAGSCAFLPRNIKHTFWNETDQPARALVLANPAGIEDFFVEIGQPVLSPDEAPPEVTPDLVARVYDIAPRYQIELDALPG